MIPGQTVTSVSKPLLVIENGPQAGCSLALQTGVFSVGKSLDNDIVVADQTLLDRHFQVHTRFSGIELKPLEGAFYLQSRKAFHRETSYFCRKNFTFSAGNTTFKIVIPKRTHIQKYISFVFLTLLLTIVCIWNTYPLWSHHPAAPLVPPSSALHTGSEDLLTLQNSLQAKIAARHLDGITITAGADGALIATGAAQPEQNKLWSATKLWFDNTYGTRTLLLDRVSFSHVTTQSPVQIAGVALGAQPYVIDTSGQRLPPGSLVENGWIIDQILSDRILLHRGPEYLTVRF
nr:EscD/YscD/HrpQ family type III secretion system periplasmic domain-containing protein [uncultured Acetobacter sp.]